MPTLQKLCFQENLSKRWSKIFRESKLEIPECGEMKETSNVKSVIKFSFSALQFWNFEMGLKKCLDDTI